MRRTLASLLLLTAASLVGCGGRVDLGEGGNSGARVTGAERPHDDDDEAPGDAGPKAKPHHASCAVAVADELPELPDVNRDDSGRPLFDAWRDIACETLEAVPLCSEPRRPPCDLCFKGMEGADQGVCAPSDIDLACDGEGEALGYDNGNCWMCAPIEAHARACCAGLAGFDCRAWPFEGTSKPGMLCARHEDCEAGLICGSAFRSGGYGICQCPDSDVVVPESCGYPWPWN